MQRGLGSWYGRVDYVALTSFLRELFPVDRRQSIRRALCRLRGGRLSALDSFGDLLLNITPGDGWCGGGGCQG